jgi:hypothetical protein
MLQVTFNAAGLGSCCRDAEKTSVSPASNVALVGSMTRTGAGSVTLERPSCLVSVFDIAEIVIGRSLAGASAGAT